MGTNRQRTQVTHTDDVQHVLNVAMRKWPNERRTSTLIVLLAKEGAKTIEASVDAAEAARRREVDAISAEFAGIYPEGYLEELRSEWPGMIVLDAVVIIAFFSPTNVHHARAKNLLTTTPGPYLMHPLTAAETLVAAAKVGKDGAMWAAMQTLGIEIVKMGSAEPQLLAQLRARHGMKMPDTCVLAAATHRNIALATFDVKLGEVAESVSLRHDIPELT